MYVKSKRPILDRVGLLSKISNGFAARGYIVGNTMLVRADHPYYTAEQIARHEIGHDMIAKGEVDIEAVRKRLVETIDKEDVDAIAKHYADAYEGTNLTDKEIWEECICDSLGDMNIFAGDKTISEFMSPAMTEVKAATESTTKSPTQTRGAPEGKASRVVKQDYFSYQTLGIRVVSHIRQELQKLYADVEDGIANGIAVEYGNKVYITDSSKENGILRFGIHKDIVYEIDDAQSRKDLIKEINDEQISEEQISDGLLEKFGHKRSDNGSSNRQRSLGEELQTDIGKSEYKQEGISRKNADQGVSKEKAKQRTNDGINELLEQLKSQLDTEAESHIADGYAQTDKEMLGQLKTLLDKGTQGKASREFSSPEETKNNVMY